MFIIIIIAKMCSPTKKITAKLKARNFYLKKTQFNFFPKIIQSLSSKKKKRKGNNRMEMGKKYKIF